MIVAAPRADTWTEVPLWSLLQRKKELGRPNLPLLSVYRDYGVIQKDSRDDNHNRAGADLAAYQVVRAGDVVANKMKTWQGSIAVSDLEGLVSPAYIVCSVDTSVHSRFLHYLLRSRPYIAEYRRLSHGVRPAQWDLRWEDLRNVRLVLPPAGAQRAIADFLDRETGRIDALVEKKRRLIELLEEKRTALISHVVTKGLDPIVPMKDSGIPWLGQIPAHWDAAPTYSRYEVFLGKMLSKEAASGPNQRPYVRNLNVQWDRIDLTDLATMSFDSYECAKYRLRRDDLLVCEGGEVGRAAMWRDELEECYFQKALLLVRPWSGSQLPRFLMYVLHAAAHTEVFRVEGNQATFVHLTGEKLRSHRFGFPSCSEQEAIVEHIDDRSDLINQVISKVREQLDLLAEYRQALITTTVTGQINIGAQAPEPEEALA